MPSSIVLLLFLLRLVSAVANLYDTKSRAGRFRRRDDVAGVHVRDVSCGPAFGPCPPGECCSPEGSCLFSPYACAAPDCQIEYSDSCDATRLTPSGPSTSGIPRLHVGDVPYSPAGIYHCTTPKTIAITYDDGPNKYTEHLLDILASYNAKATFFITGVNSNKGAIDDQSYPWSRLIHRMHDEGHQIASHTWSHQNLDQISQEHRLDQMVKNEMALSNILGFFPAYMRPPYSACSDASGCASDMDNLGYHVSYFDVDTSDYQFTTPDGIQFSKGVFDEAITSSQKDGGPLLVIAHDIHEQTVYNLTTYMMQRLAETDYRAVTLGECLGDPPHNWYRSFDRSRKGNGNRNGTKGDRREKKDEGLKHKNSDIERTAENET